MSQPTPTRPGSLVLLGINHNTAPIELRERLAISVERLADATRSLVHQPGIREGLILSTCNRVELLTLQDDSDSPPPQTKTDLLRFLHEYFAVPPATSSPTSTSSASAKPSVISSG